MTDSDSSNPIRLARRAERMNASVIREILKLAERPDLISMAGGLPSPHSFPIDAVREATAQVLRDTPQAALQYASSEGFGPLREWVAADLGRQGMRIDPSQVLITTGSQQGLDLLGKVLIDAGSLVAVEAPTYLGALQAFAPGEPCFASVACDEGGPIAERLGEAAGARFLYLLPNFQNPGGRCLDEPRRDAVVAAARRAGLPLIEDNPYGELWYDEPPPAPLAARWPQGTIYLGSFSKVLAPGLRVGYLVAPPAVYPKLLQAKQAADLHTPSLNQRIVHQVVRDGLLDRHLPSVRERYRAGRDAMGAALARHMPPGCRWLTPRGGMFFWIELPPGCDALALLPRAVERGVAYVPGEAFFADKPQKNCLRLSFVTVDAGQIEAGVAALAGVIDEALATTGRRLQRAAA
ncbi:PLP-dependent aminotransferase family protein [Piscinibacter sakaiensis]|uniref:aminotransferase-like domain-containing protein n=1 Tax=Piscinibacter sakaiensis TaxID=1547922 RepID=UPI003AAF3A16